MKNAQSLALNIDKGTTPDEASVQPDLEKASRSIVEHLTETTEDHLRLRIFTPTEQPADSGYSCFNRGPLDE